LIVVDQNPYMLPRLPYALLLALAEAYPAGVGREDLYAALWADIIVEPGQVDQLASSLRRLGILIKPRHPAQLVLLTRPRLERGPIARLRR